MLKQKYHILFHFLCRVQSDRNFLSQLNKLIILKKVKLKIRDDSEI